MKVKLVDVIEALNFGNDETHHFYSIKTEEVHFGGLRMKFMNWA